MILMQTMIKLMVMTLMILVMILVESGERGCNEAIMRAITMSIAMERLQKSMERLEKYKWVLSPAPQIALNCYLGCDDYISIYSISLYFYIFCIIIFLYILYHYISIYSIWLYFYYHISSGNFLAPQMVLNCYLGCDGPG